ncbi:glycerate kinase [Streptococcus satellite phage Javan343]|nr:glycerate kinase [Streptococcus satellite phage Javan343]
MLADKLEVISTDLDNMTRAEFDKQMAEIKAKRPNLFQFIADFVDRKVSTEEVDDFLKMERSDQVDYIRNYKARA